MLSTIIILILVAYIYRDEIYKYIQGILPRQYVHVIHDSRSSTEGDSSYDSVTGDNVGGIDT